MSGGFPRPFTRSERPGEPGSAPQAEFAAEQLAGLIAGFDTESNDSEMFEDLDEMAIAFDLLSAFQTHGYQELKRPAYHGEDWLRAKVWFGEEIKGDPERTSQQPEDTEPDRISVCRLPDDDSHFGTGNGEQWIKSREIPASVLGPAVSFSINDPGRYVR